MARGGKQIKFFDEDYYTPSGALMNFTETQLRKEFSRLRKLAADRTRVLEKNDFDRTEYHFKTLKELKTPQAIAFELTMVHDYLTSWRSSLSKSVKTRQRFIEQLELTRGIHVDKNNWAEVLNSLADEYAKQDPERYRKFGLFVHAITSKK